MNAILSADSRTTPPKGEFDEAVQRVTGYLIRCGVRDTTFLREQSRRMVASRYSTTEPDQKVGSADFQHQCLQEATVTLRTLLDRFTDRHQSSCCTEGEGCEATASYDAPTSQQFAFIGTDDLLFTAEAFECEATEGPSLQRGTSEKVAMVIPTVQPRRFRHNATPALIGPLRLDWWKAVLTSWIPRPRKAVAASLQGELAPRKLPAAKLQVTQNDA